MVKNEEERLESAPYEWTDAEKELNDTEIDGYVIKLPTSKPDLKKWGSLQNHCIGGYAHTGGTKLISFWKKDKKGSEDLVINSCMELNREGTVYRERQHRGRFNNDPGIAEPTLSKIKEAVFDCYNPKPKKMRAEELGLGMVEIDLGELALVG